MMREYWIVQTRGGPGNADTLTQTECQTRQEAYELQAALHGAIMWHVLHSSTADGKMIKMMVQEI